MAHGSRKAVLTAIVANAVLTLLKFAAGVASHSASMINEAIHSLMDTLNQAFLLLGLVSSVRPADERYAFGHAQKKYLWNLWSAIGLFSIGSGLGLAHAWYSYRTMGQQAAAGSLEIIGLSVPAIVIVALVLTIAFLLEGYSLAVAIREFFTRMHAQGFRNPFRFFLHGGDSTLIAIVLEDSIAVLGIVLAALGVAFAHRYQDPVWDIGFSALIAVLLGLAAFFLGAVNIRYLTDVRDRRAEEIFAGVVHNHREIERYHDLRSIILDDRNTILMAEVELREEVIIPALKPRIAAYENEFLSMVPDFKRNDPGIIADCRGRAAAQATIERTETIIDQLEREVKVLAPQVAHVTIEVEGIATPPVVGEIPDHEKDTPV